MVYAPGLDSSIQSSLDARLDHSLDGSILDIKYRIPLGFELGIGSFRGNSSFSPLEGGYHAYLGMGGSLSNSNAIYRNGVRVSLASLKQTERDDHAFFRTTASIILATSSHLSIAISILS